MMSNDDAMLSVEELVDYCQTQARLLWGRVETLGEETDEMLAEIDEEIADARTQLEEHSTEDRAEPPVPMMADEIGDIEALESELEEKQAIIKAKQARRSAFQDLASAYVDLAEELAANVDDVEESLSRIVSFEHEFDAPAYFEDRQTLLEAAGGSGTNDER
ncbi:hypothetical protein EGH21_18790 [Halomicroarcula sp. F13]|uniref:Uncharacterized protein n=1 Tax=Haloarcula rubra TaxID=2487747 RepID=A0AAW4PX31_9EURY|nr:hypothetical protein [Halomicroarcula rubra]